MPALVASWCGMSLHKKKMRRSENFLRFQLRWSRIEGVALNCKHWVKFNDWSFPTISGELHWKPWGPFVMLWSMCCCIWDIADDNGHFEFPLGLVVRNYNYSLFTLGSSFPRPRRAVKLSCGGYIFWHDARQPEPLPIVRSHHYRMIIAQSLHVTLNLQRRDQC